MRYLGRTGLERLHGPAEHYSLAVGEGVGFGVSAGHDGCDECVLFVCLELGEVRVVCEEEQCGVGAVNEMMGCTEQDIVYIQRSGWAVFMSCVPLSLAGC